MLRGCERCLLQQFRMLYSLIFRLKLCESFSSAAAMGTVRMIMTGRHDHMAIGHRGLLVRIPLSLIQQSQWDC